MKKLLIFTAIVFSIMLVAATGRSVMAQNLTINASNTVGNMNASVNQTESEMAKNMSNAANNIGEAANQSILGASKNVNNTMSNASNAVNLSGIVKMTDEQREEMLGHSLLNQTKQVAKKLLGGAATVLGNVSEEIKKELGKK